MRTRRVAATLAVIVVIAAAVGACNKADTPPVGAKPDALADSADQLMFKARFAITDRGLRRADIQSDTAYFFRQNTLMVLHPLTGTFFSSNGAKDGIIQAREGVYDTRLGTLEARGDVLITTIDGKSVRTAHCKFDQRLNLITSDTEFFMSEPGRDVHGIGFTSDADLSTFKVDKLLSAKAGTVAIPK